MDTSARPIYMISVAAQLVGMHPQTLRMYETKGLVRPHRTPGGTRLYSEADVERLRIVQRLTSELGLNLAGDAGETPGFGPPEVRISQPFLVPTTSSSIPTPMPRHFFATLWLSAAM